MVPKNCLAYGLYVYNLETSWAQLKIEMVILDYSARFVNVEENGYRFEGLRNETWVNTQPALLIAVWERMLLLFRLTT